MNNQRSKLLSLNGRDVIKGIIMAVLSAFVSALIAVITKSGFESINWQNQVLIPTVIAVLTYISKNLLTNSNDKFLTSEPAQTPIGGNK